MKRSSINRYIAEASSLFAGCRFSLPSYANWSPEEWQRHGSEADEIRKCRLGWDITDFNSGHFDSLGLTLFTLRNGGSLTAGSSKIYAEKIMLVRQNQVTPFHFHASKTEDIINRGGKGEGRLSLQLYNANEDGGFSDSPVCFSCDGIRHKAEPGHTVILGPGESITLTPYLYHTFHAIDGHALIGEVSSVNNDDTDNYFKDPLPRYPQVLEDEPPLRLLCTEYPISSEASSAARKCEV